MIQQPSSESHAAPSIRRRYRIRLRTSRLRSIRLRNRRRRVLPLRLVLPLRPRRPSSCEKRIDQSSVESSDDRSDGGEEEEIITYLSTQIFALPARLGQGLTILQQTRQSTKTYGQMERTYSD